MDVSIRPLDEHDLPEADRIFRLAFGTFMGLPDPMSFMGDADLVKTRWRSNPAAGLGAYLDGALVGSNFAARWGSFGFFGPLTVRPDLWDKRIARMLLEATMELFQKWETRQAGLFTFPQSPKHLALYQKFGFWPQYLTPIMSKPVGRAASSERWSKYSDLAPRDHDACLLECRDLTGAVSPGLDVGGEIRAVFEQGIGDTVLLRDGGAPVGLAVCHVGAGSEAGSGSAYVKFGAVRPGVDGGKRFHRLLSACEELAAEHGVGQLVAGMNAARHDAYRAMIERGFRTFFAGVAMQRPNEPGHNRRDCFVIDDWR
jgi:GNAT superfamily N-acetyltransferase